MCVLLFDVFKHLLSRKTDALKTCQKIKLLGKKIWRNAVALKSKKVQGIFRKTFILALLSSAVFRLQNRVSDFFWIVLFVRLKAFIRVPFENEVDFRDIMNVSSNLLAKNYNFKQLRHGFVDERALITTKLISSCHWKSLVPFCLRKKRSENTFLTLIVLQNTK